LGVIGDLLGFKKRIKGWDLGTKLWFPLLMISKGVKGNSPSQGVKDALILCLAISSNKKNSFGKEQMSKHLTWNFGHVLQQSLHKVKKLISYPIILFFTLNELDDQYQANPL